MRPYYQDEWVTLYHGDCREILPTLKADVVATDAPYGISDAPDMTPNRKGKRAGGVNTWHAASDWDKEIDPEWCRLVCDAAPVVAWFGNWRMRSTVEAAMRYPIRAEIVWAKDTHVGPPCPLAMQDERIWLFSAAGLVGRQFDTTVWHEPIIPTWSKKWHKNEKPLNLMMRLLRWLPDGVVLDPFAGSGTTLRAAKDLGRKAIGIELSPTVSRTSRRAQSPATAATKRSHCRSGSGPVSSRNGVSSSSRSRCSSSAGAS